MEILLPIVRLLEILLPMALLMIPLFLSAVDTYSSKDVFANVFA